MIIFDLDALAKGEQYWSNPEEFDPRRFLTTGEDSRENSNVPTQGSPGKFPFVPFSVGKRNCPAFAVTETLFKAFVAKIVSEYDLTLMDKKEGDISIRVETRARFTNRREIC